jgi:uncharacterized protein (DUF934 family)
MSALIKLGKDGRATVVGAAGAAKVEATPRVVEGGRGDARLATYVQKPPSPDAKTKDWRDDGFVPLSDWLAGERTAPPVLLPTDEPTAIAPHLADLPLIAIAFPKFNDGRGLSIAALLRRLGFGGELRAIGDVARDQLFFMARCGFDAFALRADQDPADALNAFAEFGDVYQDAADGRGPVFRRRDETLRAAEAWLQQRRTAS